MQKIKIVNDGDGCSHVAIISGGTGETLDTRNVNANQELLIGVPAAHEQSDLEVGEVVETSAGDGPTDASAGSAEPDAEVTEAAEADTEAADGEAGEDAAAEGAKP